MASPERHAHWRYFILDECFSEAQEDDQIRWFKTNLLLEVNRRLKAIHPGTKPIAMRTLEKDLVDFEKIYGVSIERRREKGKIYFAYPKGQIGIHTGELSSKERRNLMSLLDSMGRFRSLKNWDWWVFMEVMLKGQLGFYSNQSKRREAGVVVDRELYGHEVQRWLLPIAESIYKAVPLRVAYAPDLGDATERVQFMPEFLSIRNGSIHVAGTCWDDEAEDFFRLVIALEEITSLDDVAVAWPNAQYQATPANRWSEYLLSRMKLSPGLVIDWDRKPDLIRVWVGEALAQRFLKMPMHQSQDMRVEQAANGIIFTIQVVPDDSFVAFALQHGAQFQILEPDDLRHRVRLESAAVAKLYEPMFGP
ncbi:MAG: WYL domain-containing protein [Bacteroidetes bacterium]|nr:WYL domain-containing protein [Bacteroidota bacterium]MDA1335992.1 WYL domain-containing protein [Bacteroidota bacterium]